MFVKSILVGALAALAAAQSSVISFTNSLPSPAEVGKPFTLTYTTTGSGPVSIILRKGNPNDLQTVATLTSDATGGSYQWTPATDLASGTDYALQIQQGSEINYLGPFPLTGGSASGGGSSSSSSMSTPMAPPSYGPMTTMTSSTEMTSMMMTSTAASNSTSSFTTTAMMPVGTGNATMTRNATMSMATLTKSAGPHATNGGGAGYQGTSTGPNAAQSTGGASTLMVGGSAIAIVFGAVAAVVMG
ncbi:hypothetical protein SMMN14_01432 [Sphaerulina musiva]